MLRFPALNTFLQSFLCTWSSFRGVGGKFWFWCVDFGSDVWIKALKAQVAVVPMEGLCPPGQKAHSYSVDPIDYFSFRGKKKKKTKNKTKKQQCVTRRLSLVFVAWDLAVGVMLTPDWEEVPADEAVQCAECLAVVAVLWCLQVGLAMSTGQCAPVLTGKRCWHFGVVSLQWCVVLDSEGVPAPFCYGSSEDICL